MSHLQQLAIGTWLMGGRMDPEPSNDDEKDVNTIQLALDSGIKLIDTAQIYAAGKCEELVGIAIKDRPRDSYQILTKQARDNLSYQGVIDGCKSSLYRLGLDFIDYFVCHAPTNDFDMRDFFRATNKLYKEGLIRHVGVSNFGVKSLKIALETSERPIRLNQVSFSICDDDILRTGTYDFCLRNNIPIQAFRALARVDEDPEIVRVLESIAPRYGLTIYQLAIAYINSFGNMHFTIRASSSDHWDQIKAAMDIHLESEDLITLRQLHNNRAGSYGDFLEI